MDALLNQLTARELLDITLDHESELITNEEIEALLSLEVN